MAVIIPPASRPQELIGFAIAHEVRNLLTPAKAYLQIGNASAASTAIDRALDFAEAILSSGPGGRCDVETAIRAAVDSLGTMRTVFHVEPVALGKVGMNPSVLERVIANLALNAAQGGAKAVRIVCFPWNDRTRIQLIDDGIGHRTAPEGLSRGRGLQICAFLLDQCGGTLDVEFNAGQGTTVTIDLPVAATSSKAA